MKQFLIDTRQYLYQMIRIVNVKEEIMYTLSLVGDISYAWDIIRTYVGYMQDGVYPLSLSSNGDCVGMTS